MSMSRRRFLGAGLFAAGGLGRAPSLPSPDVTASAERPLIVSTWPFGKAANERAREVLAGGGTVLDGVEQGIRLTEAQGPDRSVGIKGRPNAAGIVQVDACIMNGVGHTAGSVAGVEGLVHPITAARRVMEKTKHVMLVGEGARWFALQEELKSVDVSGHPALKKAWLERSASSETKPPRKSQGKDKDDDKDSHDTIALLALDAKNHVAGGCSTSGMANKLPGRVGDSPILGSGLYVDEEVGAAGATGVGENVMRYCASFLIVELMRQGQSPTEACEATLHRIARTDPLGYDLNISFVALDTKGRHGGASSSGFSYAMATASESRVIKVPAVRR